MVSECFKGRSTFMNCFLKASMSVELGSGVASVLGLVIRLSSLSLPSEDDEDDEEEEGSRGSMREAFLLGIDLLRGWMCRRVGEGSSSS